MREYPADSIPFLRLSHIHKEFSRHTVIANRDVSFTAYSGEIHALIGENGAGKSTLMQIAAGFLEPDRGDILISGKKRSFSSPHQALSEGVGMVYQEQHLIGELPVWENIVLGEQFPLFTGRTKQRIIRKITSITDSYALKLPLYVPAFSLTLPQQLYLSLTILLFKQVPCIILDEPTSAFSPGEAWDFHRLLHRLKQEGKTIVLISHKLDEIYSLSDRISVMCKGELIEETNPAETSKEKLLADMMGGTGISTGPPKHRDSKNAETSVIPPNKNNNGQKEVLFRMEDVEKSVQGTKVLKVENLTIERGEIVSITGIRSLGLRVLENILSGMEAPDRGEVIFRGKPLGELTYREYRDSGFAYIPTNRKERGSAAGASLLENAIMGCQRSLSTYGLLLRRNTGAFAEKIINLFGIKGRAEQPLFQLSGGNIQRVIIGRELARGARLTLFCDPGHGLDFHGREEVYRYLREERERGKSFLIISSDIDEIIDLSNRVYVLSQGKLISLPEEYGKSRGSLGEVMIQGKQRWDTE